MILTLQVLGTGGVFEKGPWYPISRKTANVSAPSLAAFPCTHNASPIHQGISTFSALLLDPKLQRFVSQGRSATVVPERKPLTSEDKP